LALQDVEDRGWQYIANDIVSSTYDTFRIVAFKGDISAREAHKTGRIVMFKGDLIKEHRPILTNVSEMKISGSEDF
jgi:hypothetical protein